MALTAPVLKQWPTLSANGILSVGVEVVLNDDDAQNRQVGALEQRRQVFTKNASKGDDVEAKVSEIHTEVQDWIDRYKDEKKAYNSAKYENLRSGVATELNLTE